MYSNLTSDQSVARVLTYSGLLPFLFFPLYLLLTGNNEIFGLDVQTSLVTYGAVIVTFIAGIHWGVFLFKQGSLNLFLHSNIIALLAWSSILSPFFWNLIILMSCLVYLLLIDTVLLRQRLLEPWFYQLRLQASALALLSLGSYGIIAL